MTQKFQCDRSERVGERGRVHGVSWIFCGNMILCFSVTEIYKSAKQEVQKEFTGKCRCLFVLFYWFLFIYLFMYYLQSTSFPSEPVLHFMLKTPAKVKGIRTQDCTGKRGKGRARTVSHSCCSSQPKRPKNLVWCPPFMSIGSVSNLDQQLLCKAYYLTSQEVFSFTDPSLPFQQKTPSVWPQYLVCKKAVT